MPTHFPNPLPATALRVLGLLLSGLLLSCTSLHAGELLYDVDFHARFEPESGQVESTIRVGPTGGRLRKLDFNAPEARYSRFEGDGKIERRGERVHWHVPEDGGSIRFLTRIDNRRRSGGYDARMTDDWAIVRLDALFPPVATDSDDEAASRSTLDLAGPDGWTFETPYGRVTGPVPTPNPNRRFDRPIGWMAAGRLGVRRQQIAGRQVTLAGPVGERFRRMDLLAMLNWNLPHLIEVLPDFPDRLLIIGAHDPMWRGGLSGPASLYLHADRPLIDEDGSSTLLHELMHVGTRGIAPQGDRWLAEGTAEYYSLTLLKRSGTLSTRRYRQNLQRLARRVEREGGQLADPSRGADTARAVLLFHDLDQELRKAGSSLDAVTVPLLRDERFDRQRLRELVEAELDGPSQVLQTALSDR